jgi:autotransporter translocation and assembly factor TamB
MELQGALGGSLDSPIISTQAKADNLRYQDFPVDSLFASVIYRDGQVHLSELHFEGRLDPIDTLRPPFHLSGISGSVAYRGDVGGRPDSLGGEISVDLIRPGYGEIHFDEGWLRARLEGQRIDLSLFQLRRDSLLFQAQGDFSLPTSSGACEIELIQLSLDSLSFENGKPILVRDIDDSAAGLQQAGKLTAAFDLSKPDQYRVNMEGDRLNLETIRHILAEPPDIGGLLGFDLALAGNMDSPEVDFDFHLRSPRFQMVEMDSVKGHLAVAKEQFAFQPLELYHKGHHSKAAGVVGLERNQNGAWTVTENNPVRGQASGQALDLRLLEPFLPGEMQVSGYASYDLTWDGTIGHPHPTGTLLLEDGAVQTAQNVPPIEKINLNASIQDSVLNVANLSGEIQGTPFKLQGNLTLSQSRNLDAEMSLSVADFGTVTGDGILSPDSLRFQARVKQMDMATLHPFFPDLAQLAGTLNTEVILSGSTADPELDGHLEIRGLTVRPDWLNMPFDQGVIKLKFKKSELQIDSVFMRLSEGIIFVSGNLTHDQGELTHADVRVNVSDVTIDRPKELILSVKSAQLSYREHNGYFLLDGDIILDESRVLVNFKPQSVLPFAQAVERPPQQLPPLLQKTRIDVRLRESEEVWVDNNLARLRMHTELGVIGSPAQPNLTGRVTVEEGYVLYLDRKFKIKRGVVDFVDPDKLNPIIDLRAETTVRTYRATEAIPYLIALTVTGPLDEVVVDLSSDPPEDKSNIISLLTIGATREELTGKDAEGKGASSALLERAQSLSSQRIAGYTSRKVGSLLGLDQFTIEGNLFSRDRSSGPQLLASKKISSRAELTYTTTVGHSNENSFRLDYRLSKHFFLEGQTDQQGRAGMNLKYRLRSR